MGGGTTSHPSSSSSSSLSQPFCSDSPDTPLGLCPGCPEADKKKEEFVRPLSGAVQALISLNFFYV